MRICTEKLLQVAQDRHPVTISHYNDLTAWREGRNRGLGVLSAASSQFSSNRLCSLKVIFAHLLSVFQVAQAPAVLQFSRTSFFAGSEALLPSITAEAAAFLVSPVSGHGELSQV